MDEAALIRRRRDAVVVTVATATVLAVLALRYQDVTGPDRWDRRLDAVVGAVAGNWSDALRPTILLLGPVSTAGVGLALVAASAARGMWRCVVLAAAVPMVCGAGVLLLQTAVGRTLNGGDALPSGHTAAAVCTAMILLLVGPRLVGRRMRRAPAVVVVLAVTALMGATLVTNGLHVTSDVVAGAAMAVASALSTAFLIDRTAEWNSRRAQMPRAGRSTD